MIFTSLFEDGTAKSVLSKEQRRLIADRFSRGLITPDKLIHWFMNVAANADVSAVTEMLSTPALHRLSYKLLFDKGKKDRLSVMSDIRRAINRRKDAVRQPPRGGSSIHDTEYNLRPINKTAAIVSGMRESLGDDDLRLE